MNTETQSTTTQTVITTEFVALIESTLDSALTRQAPIDEAKAQMTAAKDASSAAFTTQLWSAFEMVGRDFDQFTLQTDKVSTDWKKRNGVTQVPRHWSNMRSVMRRAIEDGADITDPLITSIVELATAGNKAKQAQGDAPILMEGTTNTALLNMLVSLPAEVREQVNTVIASIGKNMEACPNAIQAALDNAVIAFDKDTLASVETTIAADEIDKQHATG